MMKALVNGFILFLVTQVCYGKLILRSWPKGSKDTELYTVIHSGKTLMTCEVESDSPFQLKWYKNGKEIDLKSKPPWPFPHADGKGLTLVQFPYIANISRGEYECRATNGIDAPVSNKIKFTPLLASKLPKGFPKITKFTKKADFLKKHFYGSNVTFECDATGDNVAIRWYFRDVPINRKSPAVEKGDDELNFVLSNNDRTLKIYNLGKITFSLIECAVANDVGMISGGKSSLETEPVPKPTIPPIVPQLIVKPKNVSVGGPEQWVNFDCEATGYPKPLYHWRHDGILIKTGHPSGHTSVVAMRSGKLICIAYNVAGKVEASAYLHVKPLPYRANPIKIKDVGPSHFTVIMKPNYREVQWHKDIPITHVILNHRPYKFGQDVEAAYNTTKIALTGKSPWYYRFGNLDSWTYIDVRLSFVNRYGIGNVSEWYHGQSDMGELVDPVRNLQNIATSNQSFTLKWENPAKTNGPLKRYEVYYTTRPDALLKYWFLVPKGRTEQFLIVDWHGNSKMIADIAPVIYWKVRIVAFKNIGPYSETKVFRVYPGAPGFVTNLTLHTLDSRSIQVSWKPTKDVGNGIVGYKVLYNRQDKPIVERKWKVIDVADANVHSVKLTDLSPNRPYEVKVYPRSHAMIGVASKVIVATTLPDVPTAPPQNLRGVAKHSQTLEIYWEPPPEEHQNSPITKYKLFYTQKVGRDPYSKELGKEKRKVQLQGLGKYKKYKIWMVAYNKMGESPPSPTYEIVTSEQVPEGAPLAVQAQALNDTTIAVTWLPPSSVLQNGRIIGYKVYYSDWPNCRKGYYERLEEVTVNGANARDAVFRRFINPNRFHKVLVAALTSVGAGAKSLALCIKTPLTQPTAPIVTVTLDKTSNFVTLKWWPPPGQIKEYKIEYGKTLRKFDMLTNVKVKKVNSDVRQSVFDDLDAGVYYSFKLYGHLDKDDGWTAPNTQWLKTSDHVPTGAPLYFEGVTESASSIKLKWEEPDPWLRNGRIVGYDILYKRPSIDVKFLRARYNLRGEEDAVVYLLTELKSNSRYAIKVHARTMVGAGVDTKILYVKTNKEVLPVVNKLLSLEITTTTTYIHWSEPLNAKRFQDSTMQYLVNYYSNKTYRSDDGKLLSKTTNKTVTILAKQYQLENLMPGTTYTVIVKVDMDEAGIGDPVSMRFTTKSEKPKVVLPPKPVTSLSSKINYISIQIPAVSELYGPVDRCAIFVINLKDSPKISPTIRTSEFFDEVYGRKRRRRSLIGNGNNTTQLPEYHVAAIFQNKDLPTLFKLGDGTHKGNIRNIELNNQDHYTSFIRAYIKQGTNDYVYSDSSFSKPIKYVYVPMISAPNRNNGPNSDSTSSSGGSMTYIIAGVAGVVVILVVVIILVFIMRKRRGGGSESDRLLEKKRKGSSDPTEVHRLQSNTPGMIQHPPIPVQALAQHVEVLRANNSAKHLREFESIDPGEKPASEASLLPQNKMKNRYPNVLAFDDTRVKLDHTGILCSDYINANYIDGYCKEKAYISTQGPLKTTVEDFWRMCWEQNIQSIVMMTKVEERGRNKCEQYWPSISHEVYGAIKVLLKDERSFCHYCERTFEVSSTICNDTRIVKHFQYLQWPDPGVPSDYGPVLTFIRRVRDFDPPGCGPMVVHCSAGVGRSACFIAIDAMLERLQHDSMIDIYGYVTMMRTQRNFMVQTDEQYIFIYDVLVAAIEHGVTEIASSDLAAEFKRLTELRLNGGETLLEGQYKSLSLATNNPFDQSLSSNAHLSINESKNRCRTIVPFDHNRVVLQPIRNQDGSDYINASYVDGFYRKNAFIATQGPTEDTVADFWRMVMEQDSSIVVMLSNLEEKGKEQCFQYWPSTKTMRHYYYVIDPLQEKRFANFIVREFKITDARDTSSRIVRHYHYLSWPASQVPISADGMPMTSDGITELIGQVQKAQNKSENNGPIVVHGSTGAGRTGVFIALSIALESLRSERIVDIYQIVKTLRHERPYMVQTIEQYEYCYRVTCDFLKNFDFIV